MSIFSKLGALIFAPTDAAGNPRQVINHDAQVWSTEVERIIQVALEGGDLLVYSSLSALNADLDHPAHTGAILIGESIADDGLYVKQGASGSGSWVKIGNVPGQGFVKATNAGAGTANAIAATTPVAVNETQLILLPITAANTASPVTVAFNGGAALTVKTVSGNDVAAGGLPAGSVMLGVVQGGDFRLLSDQASAGIQAAAEAAQVAAEAALTEMREKSVGAFPDNASADAFLTAEGLSKQKGTIYFNTTADVWRYWDGSAWQTFPYAIVADGGVTEEKLADEAVSKGKLSPGLKTSFEAPPPMHDFNAGENGGLRIQLETPAARSNRVSQGLTFVRQTGEWYYILGDGTDWVDRTNTICRANAKGELIDYSADELLTLGHGQDLNHLYYLGQLTFITQSTDGNGMCAFEYTNGTDQPLANKREYELAPAGANKHTTIGLSADKRFVVAAFLSPVDNKQYVRVFDAVTLLSGATGDRMSEYLVEICLNDSPDYDGSAVNNQHMQSVSMDDLYIYSLNGFWQSTDPKYLYAFRISDGVMAFKKEVTTGKTYALTAGAGTIYEPEGLEWVFGGAGQEPVLFMGMRTGGGTGNVNWAVPILDTMGALTVNGDRNPFGISLFFSGGAHDIVWRSGSWLQFSKLDVSGQAISDVGYVRGDNDRLQWLTSMVAPAFHTANFRIEDDEAVSVDLPPNVDLTQRSCVAIITSNSYGNSAPRGMFSCRSGISPQIHSIAFAESGANVTLTTGALTGTTGTDGHFTISVHTDGKIYLENRKGQADNVSILLVGSV